MNRLIFIFYFLALFVLLSCHQQRNINAHILNSSIISGELVQENDPVALSTVGVFSSTSDGQKNICTGTILSPRIVITAAHCVGDITNVMFSRDLMNLTRDLIENKKIYVDRFEIYPTYSKASDDQMNTGDIALLHLEKQIPKGFFPAKRLEDKQFITQGLSSIIAGYGANTIQRENIPDPINYPNIYEEIKKGNINCDDEKKLINCHLFLSMDNDQMLRKGMMKIENAQYSDSEITLEKLANSDMSSCHGDSGGPAFLLIEDQYYLWGVTSRGDRTDCSQTTIYSSVVFYNKWIDESMEKLRL